MRYSIRTLLSLIAAVAVCLGPLRGLMAEPEPYWALSLIALVCIGASAASVVVTSFDPPPLR